MSDASVYHLDTLIDEQRVKPSTVLFLAIATLALLADGFDLSAIGYVGPELIKQWHINPAELAPIFSAGIFGLLAGAPLLGFFGDRFGRKKAIVLGLCVVAVFTLATVLAETPFQFVALRFLTGVGLGGVIPNVIALAAEMAPKRLRGMFVVIVNFGVPAGIALPGFVAAGLVPRYGWPVLMLVGGLLPLGVAGLVALLVPESMRYLVQRGGREAEVARLARSLRPDLAFGAAPRFAVARAAADGGETAVASGSPKGLFLGSLALITPILWVALAANQMANFFSLTWLPTLLQSAGSSTARAGISSSMFSLGGLIGGVCLLFLMDAFGVIPLVALFFMGVPLLVAIGWQNLDPVTLAAIIAGAGFCVTGINFGMSATLGMIYPTPVRSLGTGWANAMGRIGSLAAPLVGGSLLGLKLPLQDLVLAPAAFLGVGALASVALAVLCVRRFGGYRLDETPAPGHPPPVASADLPATP